MGCSISIPFKYAPRSHPPSLTIHDADFFGDVKANPDGWYQSTGVLERTKDSTSGPVELHVSPHHLTHELSS